MGENIRLKLKALPSSTSTKSKNSVEVDRPSPQQLTMFDRLPLEEKMGDK